MATKRNRRRKAALAKASDLTQRLDAADILMGANGLTPGGYAALLRRRDAIRFLLAQTGTLHLTKALARGLGLRRRALRAEISGWMREIGPWKGQIAWAGRNWLVAGPGLAGPHLLDLDGRQLALIFAALRLAEGQGLSTRQRDTYSALRSQLAHMLPVSLRQALESPVSADAPGLGSDLPSSLAPVLEAMRQWRRLALRYEAAGGDVTERTVWPLVLHYNDTCLIGWCELRAEFRSFRLDRIQTAEVLPDAPPRPRAGLLAEWEETQHLD